MEIEVDRDPNKVLVDKKLRDEVVENANNIIEDKLKDIIIVDARVKNISETIKSHNSELKRAKEKYKLDKKVCRQIMRSKLQRYKAFIDMKYTSDKEEYIDQSLIPKKLRIK